MSGTYEQYGFKRTKVDLDGFQMATNTFRSTPDTMSDACRQVIDDFNDLNTILWKGADAEEYCKDLEDDIEGLERALALVERLSVLCCSAYSDYEDYQAWAAGKVPKEGA